MTDTEILDWLQNNRDQIEIRMNDDPGDESKFVIFYPAAAQADDYTVLSSLRNRDLRDLVTGVSKEMRLDDLPVIDPEELRRLRDENARLRDVVRAAINSKASEIAAIVFSKCKAHVFCDAADAIEFHATDRIYSAIYGPSEITYYPAKETPGC